jgi:hypothetical protein
MRLIDPTLSPGRRRIFLGAGVSLISLAAVALLYFVLGLSEEGRFRFRVDLSEVGRNSLDETTESLLGNLQDPVVANVFFRNENSPLGAAVGEAQGRMIDLLLVASKLNADNFEFVVHDMSDLAATRTKMQELDAEEQSVVLAQGDRHALIRLSPDIAEFQALNEGRTAFKMASFKGEEVLVEALLKVSSSNRPRILFSSGHGERDPESMEAIGIGEFAKELSGDGFDVGVWDAGLNGPIGDGVTVLAIIAPEDAFAPEELDLVRAYVERGGRLFVIPGKRLYDGPGSMGELLRDYGMLSQKGVACMPVVNPDTGNAMIGQAACADFTIGDGGSGVSATHPVTKPIWEAARKVRISLSRSFDRGQAPKGGLLLDLLTTRGQGGGAYFWLDYPDESGQYDWAPGVEEPTQAVRISMSSEFPVGERANLEVPDFDNPPDRARVLGVACSDFAANALFSFNRDFLMNGINWLVEREFNVRVRRHREERTMLDVNRGTEIIALRRFAWWGLPGFFALVGAFLAWRRRD